MWSWLSPGERAAVPVLAALPAAAGRPDLTSGGRQFRCTERAASRLRPHLREAADYLVGVLDRDDYPVKRLAGQVKDHSGPRPVADREGNTVTVPDGANQDYARQRGTGSHPVHFRHPVRDCSCGDHCCPRHRDISVQRFDPLRYRQGHGDPAIVNQQPRHWLIFSEAGPFVILLPALRSGHEDACTSVSGSCCA